MTQATLASWLRVETFENIAGWQMTVRDLETGRSVSTRGGPHESKAVARQVLSDALRLMRSGEIG